MNKDSSIILVEDDRPLADAVSQYLTGEGFSVQIVADGNAAVPAVMSNQPDLVILDIMLPGKDGMQICRELRPAFNGYIIMFTAREDEIDQIVGLELGDDTGTPTRIKTVRSKGYVFVAGAWRDSEAT